MKVSIVLSCEYFQLWPGIGMEEYTPDGTKRRMRIGWDILGEVLRCPCDMVCRGDHRVLVELEGIEHIVHPKPEYIYQLSDDRPSCLWMESRRLRKPRIVHGMLRHSEEIGGGHGLVQIAGTVRSSMRTSSEDQRPRHLKNRLHPSPKCPERLLRTRHLDSL